MSDREQLVTKLRRDHDYMAELMHRIIAHCDRLDTVRDCNSCHPNQRVHCHENVDQLIRTFVDFTLRHNLMESACMEDCVPHAHKLAHNRAHMEIAERLTKLRRAYAGDGNGIVAIDGIRTTLDILATHIAEYDSMLENYLLAA